MKKTLYIILLAVEILVGLLMMGLVYSNVGWLACVVILGAVAAFLVPRISRLKRTEDGAARKKLLRQIALIVLIPAAVGLALSAYVVISLILYFG